MLNQDRCFFDGPPGATAGCGKEADARQVVVHLSEGGCWNLRLDGSRHCLLCRRWGLAALGFHRIFRRGAAATTANVRSGVTGCSMYHRCPLLLNAVGVCWKMLKNVEGGKTLNNMFIFSIIQKATCPEVRHSLP